MSGIVRYAPGRAHVVVTPHGLVVVGGEVSSALVARLWEEVSAGRGLAAVLEALTGAFGTSLSAIPPFVVALSEQSAVRLAVRGSLSVRVVGGAGTEVISGAGVTTWSERVIAAVTRVEIDVRADAASPTLPVGDGVVLASAVEWLPVPAAAPDPEPVAPREPEPDRPAMAPVVPPASPPAPRGPWSAFDAESPTPRPDAAALIDSAAVSSLTDADTLLPPDSTRGVGENDAGAPPADESATTGYDHLWGATVARVVEDAAVRNEEGEEGKEAEEHDDDAAAGDHDGATVTVAQARALRDSRPSVERTDQPAPPPLAPPRPPAPGRVRVSTGQVLTLDRTVVIGRRPRSTRVTGTDLPHLVAVDSPQQDISRSHVELRAEGDSIVAIDLHTTNGTTLRRSGVDPMRLHPGEPTVVVPGDVIDLGDDITVVIESPATEEIG